MKIAMTTCEKAFVVLAAGIINSLHQSILFPLGKVKNM